MTREEEIAKHVEMLNKRKRELQDKFPSLTDVRLFLLTDVTEDRIAPDATEVTTSGLVENR